MVLLACRVSMNSPTFQTTMTRTILSVCLPVCLFLGYAVTLFAVDIPLAAVPPSERPSAERPSEGETSPENRPWLVESKDRISTQSRVRMLWADSVQYQTIAEIFAAAGESQSGTPAIEIERWVNDPPQDLRGKFVLIKFWATWCPPCRRAMPLMEYFHEKYKDELVVVSICETDEEALKTMPGPLKLADMKAPLAVDTHRRFANALGVYGIPHAVLIEPVFGAVLWEGMPTQIGAELSDEVMTRFLSHLKNPAIQARMPEKAPFEFKAMPPDPNKTYRPAPDKVIIAGEESAVEEGAE